MLNKLRQKHALPSGFILFFFFLVFFLSFLFPIVVSERFSFNSLRFWTGEGAPYGVDINTGGIADSFANFVWEPSVVKVV